MNKFVRYLNKTFIKCVRVMLIAPKDQKKTCLLLVYAVMVVTLFATSIYLRYKYDSKDLSQEILIMYGLYGIAELCGCLTVLIILYTYRKTHLWQRLYTNVNILDEQQCHTVIIVAFFVQVSVFFYVIMQWNVRLTNLPEIFFVILIDTPVFILFIYHLAVHTLYITIVLDIKQKLIIVKEQLNSDLITMDIATMYASICQAIEGGKTFNCLFGYQLLIYYFQWFVFLVQVLINIVLMMNPKKYNYPTNILENISLFACELGLITFGPCAVAFACDMVATEADKLMAACYAAQEKFHYNSREYQELQSLGSILGSGVLQFTAAKFMEIKRSTLLSIMAAATTYFIALVQFY
ncbi:hypothetical protein ABEB36_002406 [Hypothenemus hampei]|uniref:Gustatory receptor n=1 Tax=Hypothenemus hampei TaxID=57062 RepID=A0ABD1F8Q5_HYPHA